MKAHRGFLLSLLACSLATAQSGNGEDGVIVTTRAASQESNQGASSPKTKLNLGVRFLHLPESEAADFWGLFAPANRSVSQIWTASMSEQGTKRQTARWQATPGVTNLAQISITTFTDFTVDTSRAVPSAAQPEEKRTRTDAGVRAFLCATPTINPSDGGRICVTLAAGLTNSAIAGPPSKRFSTSINVWDGQTIALGNPLDERGQPAEKSTDPRLVLLISPVIIDDQSP